MKWNDSHKNPPVDGQKVYYFGPHIGIGIGRYSYDEDQHITTKDGERVNLCPHLFKNESFGLVDACDAPYWLPYDEIKAKSYCPIIPEEYTKDLYD